MSFLSHIWKSYIKSRLALWIYLVGLAQFVAVALGFSALLSVTRPPGHGPFEDQVRYVVETLTPLLQDPPALDAELSRIQRHLHLQTWVIAPDGTQLATSTSPETPRCQRSDARGIRHSAFCERFSLIFPGNQLGYLDVFRPGRPPLLGWQVAVIVLVVTGITSLLLARALAQPLRQLSETARAFGKGDFSARTQLRRLDEFGEVAQAFDEMAEHVTALLRAEKELLASISHELRTPLARIRVALDLAVEGDPEVTRESLMDISGDLDELERLIRDVLIAARLELGGSEIESGIPPLRRQPIAVADLLSQSKARFCTAHPTRPLVVEIPEGLPMINVDPVLLRRVIDNVLENAHKYTEQPEAPIRLVARGQKQIEIEVIDLGIGISAEDLSQVFRPFFRVDRSRTRATGGLGLGLALSRRILEAHQGSLVLESVLHRGTCARMTLPVA